MAPVTRFTPMMPLVDSPSSEPPAEVIVFAMMSTVALLTWMPVMAGGAEVGPLPDSM